MLAWSATPLVFCVLVALCLVYTTIRPNTKLLTCKAAVIAMGLMLYFFVFNSAQERFSWLIVDILQRGLTFSGRTVLWETILRIFPEQPVFGYAIRDSVAFPELLGGNANYVHGHNQILDILLKSGLLGLSLFVILLICLAFELDRVKDVYSRAILCVTVPLLVASCFTEPPFTAFFSSNIIFILAFRLKEIRGTRSHIQTDIF
jgi:O-antigen ligase